MLGFSNYIIEHMLIMDQCHNCKEPINAFIIHKSDDRGYNKALRFANGPLIR